MGGKGSIPQPPPETGLPEKTGGSDTELMQQMMKLIGEQSMAAVAAAAQPPQMPAIPTLYEAPKVDWGEKVDQLNQKMKTDYGLSKAQKKGLLDTISPKSLLDDSEPSTTHKSILANK